MKPLIKRFHYLFMCISFFQWCGIVDAQQEQPATPSASLSVSPYLLGEETARENERFPGSFVTGLVFGASLPVIGGGTAVLAYQSTGKSGIIALSTFIAGATLWIWGGKKLAQHQSISIPERFRAGYNQQDWEKFQSGYTETAMIKRSAQYNFGVVLGVLIDIGIIGLIIADSNFAPGS